MGTPREIEVSCDGEVSILYGDNDMFGGHDIQIEVDADDEIEDWDIVG